MAVKFSLSLLTRAKFGADHKLFDMVCLYMYVYYVSSIINDTFGGYTVNDIVVEIRLYSSVTCHYLFLLVVFPLVEVSYR